MGTTASYNAVSISLLANRQKAYRNSLRKTQPPRFPRPNELLAQNPYTPTSTLAEAIMHSSRLLTELVVVREWLHDTAPEPQAVDATTGYWKFTKHQTMQNLRLNKQNALNGMDPDAVNRGDGGSLAPDDVVHDKALVSALYAYIRAGRLDDAIELCNKADQPWRAASIRGSLLFQWRAIGTSRHTHPYEYSVFIYLFGWCSSARGT